MSKHRRAVIITALPIERASVLQHLRNVAEEPVLNGSIYRRGVFDERSKPWDVIVAEIGAGNVGAAAEAERVISHYSPEVAIFVGVAGAIKDLKHGDVAASTKVYGYEAGKEDEGGFKPRPSVQLTAYALEQRARYEAGEPDWRQRIKDPVTLEFEPAARVAPIAAGEKVVASNRARIYKFIRQNYGDAVAVEMEGHGFLLGVHMNHPTQGLVVRSMSDLVNDKAEANDDKWQPIAARHAAAFAFQVLAKLPPPSGAGSPRAVTDSEALACEMDDLSFVEIEQVTKFLLAGAAAPTTDLTLLSPEEKLQKNGLTDHTRELLYIGLIKASLVRKYVEHQVQIDQRFPDRLKAAFLSEYHRLYGEGVRGDDLFGALEEFASRGGLSIRTRAAALAVLTYLFELCEVFEK